MSQTPANQDTRPTPAEDSQAAPAPVGEPTARAVQVANWPLALGVITIGMFMSVLDISIVNVAIPRIQNEFGVSTTDIEWISTAYSLALGVTVPVSGWLGERFGLGRLYALCVMAFGAASALCGMAWDLDSLIVFRIVQAVPGGILPVITLTMMYRVVPKDKIGMAMAAYGMSAVFAPATGPTLGGYLVEYQSWRWIFFLNVPIGLIGSVLAIATLPRFPRVLGTRFDTAGFAAVTAGLFALLLALSKGADWGWSGYRVLILLTAGVLLLALFVVIELEVDNPLLDVRLFRIWPFTNSLVLIGVFSSAFFTVLFYVPLFLQHGQGITPLNTGVAMLPEALTMLFTLPVAGWLYSHLGPRWPIVIGTVITAFGTYLLCGISPEMSLGDVMVWTSVRGFGQAFAMVPLMTAGLDKVPSAKLDGASALNNVMQRVAGALGLAVLTSFAARQTAQIAADRAALSSTATSDARVTAMVQQGPQALLPYFRLWELKVTAQVYSNLFFVLAAVTLAAAATALTLPAHKTATDQPHAAGAL